MKALPSKGKPAGRVSANSNRNNGKLQLQQHQPPKQCTTR
jgi:hypothetical protein